MHRVEMNIELQEWLPLLAPRVEETRFENDEKELQYWQDKFIALGCNADVIKETYKLFKINYKKVPCERIYNVLLQMDQSEVGNLKSNDILFLSGEKGTLEYFFDNQKLIDKKEKEKYLQFAILTEDIFILKELLKKLNSLANFEKTSIAKEAAHFMAAYREMKKSIDQYDKITMLYQSGSLVSLQLRQSAAEIFSMPKVAASDIKILCDCMKGATAVVNDPFNMQAIDALKVIAENQAPGNAKKGRNQMLKGGLLGLVSTVLMLGLCAFVCVALSLSIIGFPTAGLIYLGLLIGYPYLFVKATMMNKEAASMPLKPEKLSGALFKLADDASVADQKNLLVGERPESKRSQSKSSR